MKVEIYPEFLSISGSRDILIQGRDFQAIWDEEKGSGLQTGLTSLRLDRSLFEHQKNHKGQIETVVKTINYNWTMDQLPNLEVRLPDNGQELNAKLIFADEVLPRERKTMPLQGLPYSLEKGEPVA